MSTVRRLLIRISCYSRSLLQPLPLWLCLVLHVFRRFHCLPRRCATVEPWNSEAPGEERCVRVLLIRNLAILWDQTGRAIKVALCAVLWVVCLSYCSSFSSACAFSFYKCVLIFWCVHMTLWRYICAVYDAILSIMCTFTSTEDHIMMFLCGRSERHVTACFSCVCS